MRVMVLVKANRNSEAGVLPDTQQLTDMGKFNEELVNAGIMLAGEGIHPTSKGKRVRFNGHSRTVINGPFNFSESLIAGYWIWKVTSVDEAVEWVKRCPDSMGEGTEVEIRPIFEAEDFGEALTPELREQEEQLRARSTKEQQS